jgi:hypothetical protein
MDPLFVNVFTKSALHLSPVPRLRPFASIPSVIEGNDGRAHAQFVPAQGMVVFTVEGGVSQYGVESQPLTGLLHDGREGRGIVAGASTDGGADPEIRFGLTKHH